MESVIQEMLDTASESGSPNTLSVTHVHDWLSEYLAAHDEDVQRFPRLAGKAHGDILIADFDETWASLFVVALFATGKVMFAAGRGGSSELRAFADQGLPADMSELVTDIRKRFAVIGDTPELTEQDVRKWVGVV